MLSPPGTGKTLLAKALCNELGAAMGVDGKKVTFFYKKGAETNSKWFGESEKNLRNLFAQAKAAAPSVIFFDEIDGLCPNRDRSARTSEAYTSVVTAMLGLIDSVKRGQVLIIAATNRVSEEGGREGMKRGRD
jgi:SpoVK/Ycf46/Vps4 family AAA+-type ATPase